MSTQQQQIKAVDGRGREIEVGDHLFYVTSRSLNGVEVAEIRYEELKRYNYRTQPSTLTVYQSPVLKCFAIDPKTGQRVLKNGRPSKRTLRNLEYCVVIKKAEL